MLVGIPVILEIETILLVWCVLRGISTKYVDVENPRISIGAEVKILTGGADGEGSTKCRFVNEIDSGLEVMRTAHAPRKIVFELIFLLLRCLRCLLILTDVETAAKSFERGI